jgi:predicted GIY-YIG superfamily endonuclease
MEIQIYAFFYIDSGVKKYFYVGRSKDLSRRMREHQRSKVKGHEDKYERIRQLEATGISWECESVETVPDEFHFPDAERWHVIRLTREGHQLENMRHGSVAHRKELAEQIQSKHIRSAADVRTDRNRRACQPLYVLRG